MIAFKCSNAQCLKAFSVKDEFAGKKTKCPKCGTPLVEASGAYRVFWCYGPDAMDLTIIAITPDP